jgi:hypothetical protein
VNPWAELAIVLAAFAALVAFSYLLNWLHRHPAPAPPARTGPPPVPAGPTPVHLAVYADDGGAFAPVITLGAPDRDHRKTHQDGLSC